MLIDMDDTIFDHSLTCRAAIAALRKSRSYLRRRSVSELWDDYTHLLDGDQAQIRAGQLTVAQARTERWRRVALSCGTDLDADGATALSQAYRDLYQRLRRPVPGALPLLERLHAEARVVVVTNNEVAEQEEKVRFLGIGSLIDGLVVSEAVGVAKPDPKIFRTALEIAGVPAGSATMLGDSWTSDVLGAKGVGVRAVWFNRFGRPSPDHGSVPELRSLRPLRPARDLLLGGSPGPARVRAGPKASAL